MKLGIITGYNADSFDYVKSKGLEFIESCRNNDDESRDFAAHVPEIKANIARTGIPIGSVGRWNSHPNQECKFDASQMELQYSLIDAAIAVGSPVFVCGCNYAEDFSLFKNYAFAVEYFGRLIEYAAGRVKIAAYNCDWGNFVCSEKEWEVVLGELPELGIKFDCSHSINRGEDYLAALSNWGERIYHFHVKGTARVNGRGIDDPPAGIDGTDWGTVFAILYARGYNGGLSLEPHSNTWRAGSDLGNKGIDFAINYIRKFVF